MKTSGIWLVIFGIVLVLVAGVFSLMTLEEYGNYTDLKRQGNPFAGLVSNSYIYLGGITVVAALAGVGFILIGTQMKTTPQVVAQIPAGTRQGDWVWDGERWVTEAEWGARFAGVKRDGYTWDGTQWVLDASNTGPNAN